LGRTEVDTVYKKKRGKEDDVKKEGIRNSMQGQERKTQDKMKKWMNVMLAEEKEDTLKKTESKINKSIKRWKSHLKEMRSYR
jgi:hypothetical protein